MKSIIALFAVLGFVTVAQADDHAASADHKTTEHSETTDAAGNTKEHSKKVTKKSKSKDGKHTEKKETKEETKTEEAHH